MPGGPGSTRTERSEGGHGPALAADRRRANVLPVAVDHPAQGTANAAFARRRRVDLGLPPSAFGAFACPVPADSRLRRATGIAARSRRRGGPARSGGGPAAMKRRQARSAVRVLALGDLWPIGDRLLPCSPGYGSWARLDDGREAGSCSNDFLATTSTQPQRRRLATTYQTIPEPTRTLPVTTQGSASASSQLNV